MPIPERLTKKILQLEFIEMRELMPETWLRDEEESTRNALSLPQRRSAPVTDILQCMATVLCWNGRRLVTEIPSHGAGTDGVSG